MSPLEELHAAELTRDQNNYFIGYLASTLNAHDEINRSSWSHAIKDAKGDNP